jgi:hypothetical protein
MSLADRLVRIEEVAAALDRTEDWVQRNWLKMHLEHGMPRKLPTGWQWPRVAMERWIDAHGFAVDDTSVNDEHADLAADLADLVANQNRRHRDRYSGAGR